MATTPNGVARGARYHARVALIYAIEPELVEAGAPPEEIEVAFAEDGP